MADRVTAVRVIECTRNMQIRIAAVPGENDGCPGYVDLSHWRRSPSSSDPDDFGRVGAGIRLRVDRLETFVDLLDELATEAELLGIWRRRGAR